MDWKTINGAHIDLDDPSNPVTGSGKMSSLHESNQNKPKGKNSPVNKTPKTAKAPKTTEKTLTSNKQNGNLNKTNFKTPTNDYAQKSSEAFEKQLTTKQYGAIEQYTGQSYARINGFLRGVPGFEKLSTELKGVIKDANAALKSYDLKEDIKVFRNVEEAGYEAIKAAFEKGEPFTEKGFMSTSTDAGTFSFGSNCHIEVEVPKGKGRGAFIQSISQFSSEKEFLIPSGKSFDIVEFDDSDKYDVKVKLRMKV